MKIHFTQSIIDQVDYAIYTAIQDNTDIDYIQLSEHEYMQFLEELSPTQRILLSVPPKRCYRSVQLKIVP